MPTASFGIMVVEWMFTSAILADGREWADTEGGILRSCAAYCLDRFQLYQKSRLEIKFNALFFYNTIYINHYPVCLLPCPYAKCGAQGAAHEQPQMEPQCMLKTHVGSEKGFTSGLGVHNQSWYETNLLSQVTYWSASATL